MAKPKFKLYRVVCANAQYWNKERGTVDYVGKGCYELAEAEFIATVPKEGITAEFIARLPARKAP